MYRKQQRTNLKMWHVRLYERQTENVQTHTAAAAKITPSHGKYTLHYSSTGKLFDTVL